MKSVIDCDGVFEVLTRAPFPTGSEIDEAVEAHLLACHDCRQLADALRPAVGLIHESLAEHDSLPEYGGMLAERKPARFLRRRRLVEVGPLVAAGLAACLVLWLLQSASRQDPPQGGQSKMTSVLPDENGLIMLASMNLPGRCLAPVEKADTGFPLQVAASPMASLQEVRFLCCSHCHHPGGVGAGTIRALQSVAVACTACHEGDTSKPGGTSLSNIPAKNVG